MYTHKQSIAELLADELFDAEKRTPRRGLLTCLSEYFRPIEVPVLGADTDSGRVSDFYDHGPDGLWALGGGCDGLVILLSRRHDSEVQIHVPRFVAELLENASQGRFVD